MWVLVVALVLLATYVSIGREFMPVVSRYTDFFETQISSITGLPLNVDSLTGSFQGFNPSIRINGLQLLVDAGTAPATARTTGAFEFAQATLVIDVPRSIWQRRWVFSEFLVEGLAIEVEQTESGSWQLHDISMGGAGDVDAAAVYQAFLQVARLNLRNVQVNLTTQNQNTIQITNGTAEIQNRAGNHFLHVSANLGNSIEQLLLSVEVRGGTLEDISGRAHVSIPAADYSSLLRGEKLGEVAVQELIGGGDFWLQLEQGRAQQITASIAVASTALLTTAGATLALQDIGGDLQITQGEQAGNLDFVFSDMALSSGDLQWTPFNARLSVAGEQSISLDADLIDLSLLNQLARNSGLLSAAATAQLAAYNPQGELTNLTLYWPLARKADEAATVRTNLRGVELGSVNNSPSLWGLDGYLEASYSGTTRIATGFGEIESNRFRINIPSVFVDTWDYDYVNGRLDFRADLNAGQHISMVSNPVVARSASMDGRVQFASSLNRHADGRRDSNLDLLVGVLEADGSLIAPYLPNAPKVAPALKQTMEWLNGAVLGGSVRNSGVIYRGSTVPGAPAVTKTFQSFYEVEEGVVAFSPEWPQLSEVAALVLTNDDKIDVAVTHASSMNVTASNVAASVRRNTKGENWVEIAGVATAPTAAGLAYLQAAPVGEGLRNAMNNWQAEGNFNADIEVRVPLSQPEAATDVRVEISIEDNALTLPDYALDITGLSGPVVFDTRTGLEASTLSGQLFQQPATIALESTQVRRQLQNISVTAAGVATPATLIEWPLQSQFVRQILAEMDGQFNFTAKVGVPVSGAGATSLTIDTSLQGAALTLPAPFAKTAAAQQPLHLEILFDDSSQRIAGTLGVDTAFQLRLEQGEFQGGLLALGKNYTDVDAPINTESSGLAVVGQVDHLEVEQWLAFLAAQSGAGAALDDSIAFIDINVASLQVYAQQLPDVGVRIESNASTGYWDIALSGAAVTGMVNVPFSSTDYLQLQLAHLHLPGADPKTETATSTATAEIEAAVTADPAVVADPVPRIDALVGIDPRTLPKLRFGADAVTIGERDFGAWRFTLDPNATGAEFSDLAFDFRGLRLGDLNAEAVDPAAVAPHFSWRYDGANHSSALSGILLATNMADVLTANAIAPSLNSTSAKFETNISWPGSPAFFAGAHLSGDILLDIDDGRFEQVAGSSGALKLISIINFDAIMRRLRFSDDLLRRGLAYDSIDGNLKLEDGKVTILDRLVISGPSSLYQITGEINLTDQTINGEMYLTLPVSANIPWLGLLTANIPLAVGAYLFDRIFGAQVNNLTSAVYTLQGPWEGLQPQFKQAFGSPGTPPQATTPATVQ